MAKQLLQHYRLMTSGFKIQRYCKEVNCSWLKWEPNNKMNAKLGVTEVDDSCFEDIEYRINGQSAPKNTYFVADSVRSVSARHPQFFGDHWIAVYGQKVEALSENDWVPHDLTALMKVDGYSNGCVFVDDIPTANYHHRFQIGL